MQENFSTKEKPAKRIGQVIKKGKDKYLIRVYLYQNSEGKRTYFSQTVNGTKKEAEQVLTDYLQKKNVGILKQRPSEQTLDEFAKDYLINISNARRRNRELD